MLITTNAIVLTKIRFNDNDLIVKCYTNDKGITSYILKGILKSKKNNKKIAYFQPLSQLQLETDYKENRSLQYIKDLKSNFLYTSLHTNILKSAIAMFIAEILAQALKEEEQNVSPRPQGGGRRPITRMRNTASLNAPSSICHDP